MKKHYYFIILIFISELAYSCDCKEFSSSQEFNFSKNVFIGKIITVNDDIFSAEILENFKGSSSKIISFKYNDCSINPKVGESWLIYTTVNGYYVSYCGWSRNLRNPEQSIQYMGPVLFINDAAKKEIANLKKDKAILELKLDLIKLRESKHAITSKSRNFFHNVNFRLIIIVLTFLILLVIYLLLKNRQFNKRVTDIR